MVSSHQSDMISSCSHLARSVSRICEGASTEHRRCPWEVRLVSWCRRELDERVRRLGPTVTESCSKHVMLAPLRAERCQPERAGTSGNHDLRVWPPPTRQAGGISPAVP